MSTAREEEERGEALMSGVHAAKAILLISEERATLLLLNSFFPVLCVATLPYTIYKKRASLKALWEGIRTVQNTTYNLVSGASTTV